MWPGLDWKSGVQYSLWPAGLRAFAATATRILFGGLAVFVPAGALQLLAQHLRGAVATPVRMLLVVASAAVALLTYVLFVHYFERRGVSELATRRCSRELALGFLLGLALFSAVVGVLAACGALRITGSATPWVLLHPLVVSIAAGVFEELLFRGVLLRILETALGSWLALALSSAVFGVAHLGAPHASWFSAIAIMLEAGGLLGSTYFLTRRLWLPIGLHIGWNFTQGGIFSIAVSGNATHGLLRTALSGPTWLTGGAFGAEASLPAIVICAIAALLLLAMAARRGQLQPPPWSIRPATVRTSRA
jgi:membrane protease YdiL (CAAX protease family)